MSDINEESADSSDLSLQPSTSKQNKAKEIESESRPKVGRPKRETRSTSTSLGKYSRISLGLNIQQDKTSKFLANWNPETSNRETRKITRKCYSEKKKFQMYDSNGIHLYTGKDLCDCLEEECEGCHFPCTDCKSPKCGHVCRKNRTWVYDSIDIEGTDYAAVRSST